MERATVIVALPSLMSDEIYKVSSEEVPHLTLLYLGDVELSAEAMLYIQHACRELSPFGMTVDYRGTLGEDDADVLFLEKNWGKRVEEFRHYLLANDEIKRAYDSAEQYPEWTPHITLGYPEKPAKELEDGEKLPYYIDFDRVAVWTDDFEGPEFRLKYADDMEVAMSDISTEQRGQNAVAELFHYGVKGMKWGVRKSENTQRRADSMALRSEQRSSRWGSGAEKRAADKLQKKADRQRRYEDRILGPKKDSKTSVGSKDRAAERTPTDSVVTQKKPGTYAKSEGGANHPLHPDAESALATRQKARASKTDALSNTELKSAIERMRLEQQYKQLEFSDDRRSRGQKFIQGLFGQRKPRKFKDMDEEYGEEVRKALAESIAMHKQKKQDAA